MSSACGVVPTEKRVLHKRESLAYNTYNTYNTIIHLLLMLTCLIDCRHYLWYLGIIKIRNSFTTALVLCVNRANRIYINRAVHRKLFAC